MSRHDPWLVNGDNILDIVVNKPIQSGCVRVQWGRDVSFSPGEDSAEHVCNAEN